jgi:anti-sigma B factor antagonist
VRCRVLAKRSGLVLSRLHGFRQDCVAFTKHCPVHLRGLWGSSFRAHPSIAQRTLVGSMLMKISHEEIAAGTVVIVLAGKIMMGPESEQITNLVEELLRQGKRTIIFNVPGVVAIDSTGIGRFIASYNAISSAGGAMRITGATKLFLRAFRACRLDTVFQFDAVEEEPKP